MLNGFVFKKDTLEKSVSCIDKCILYVKMMHLQCISTQKGSSYFDFDRKVLVYTVCRRTSCDMPFKMCRGKNLSDFDF